MMTSHTLAPNFLITNEDSPLNEGTSCAAVATSFNILLGRPGAVECDAGRRVADPTEIRGHDGMLYHLDGWMHRHKFILELDECDQVADALNRMSGVSGVECYAYARNGRNTAYLTTADGTACNQVALALDALVGGKSNLEGSIYNGVIKDMAMSSETVQFKTFYAVAVPLTTISSGFAGFYAYRMQGGDENWLATLLFAVFVGLRVYDMLSDWGMWCISLQSYHTNTPLRHASLVFTIIGTILLGLDLKTMHDRASHWFGTKDRSEALKSVGYAMLAIVFLEDIPQAVITIKYMMDMTDKDENYFISASGEQLLIPDRTIADDPIAVTSLIFSLISMIVNSCIGLQSLA